MRLRWSGFLGLTAGLLLGSWPVLSSAQEATPKQGKSSSRLAQQSEAPGLSDKEKAKREESLQKELEGAYRKWLQDDVGYIITDEEKAAFKRLQNDEEREQFIEQFWLRRSPDPENPENAYKEEHYRRIAYANEHFASGAPGSKTDRGRIYIMHGPPDEINARPAGGPFNRPMEEGGGSTLTYPFETWRYRYIEGVGQDIELEFVDPTRTGEYHLTMDPSEKDALLYVPGAGLSLAEEMGLADKSDRFKRTDGMRLPQDAGTSVKYNQFERVELYANIQKPPVIKFKDLEELVTTNIRFNMLPFQVRADFVKVTGDTVLSGITVSLKNKGLMFQDVGGVQHAVVNIFGRVTTLTRRVVQTFEDTITLDVPNSLLSQTLEKPAIYWKSIPLRPGLYRLSLALKDINSGNVGTMDVRLDVPRYEDDQLATSSLILADLIEKVPTKRIGLGQFVIGGTKVRPAVQESFSRDQRLGVYLQVYNLKSDTSGYKPAGTIEYILSKDGQTVMQFSEEAAQIPEASPSQVVVEKMLALNSLQPGRYKLQVKITDKVTQRSVASSADFMVQ